MTSLRYAVRSLRRSPGFVAVAVLSLGIGLGLTTTMFAVLDALWHPPVPYRDADRVFTVQWYLNTRHLPVTTSDAFRFIRDNARSFDAVVPMGWGPLPFESHGSSRDLFVLKVPAGFFPVINVEPWLGRGFGESDVPGEGVIVSRGIWRELYGSRRSLQGATATLGGQPYPIVGVMPRGADLAGDAAMLVPASAGSTGNEVWRPLVRLRPGVTLEQASAEMASLARQMTDLYNARLIAPFEFSLVSVREGPGYVRDVHKAMVGAAVAVLLIACANLANLMLARGLAKRREVALRLALGASRATVVRQMFLECAIIAAAGGALGALLSIWGGDILISSIPRELAWRGIVEPQLSWRVFALSAVAVSCSAVVFGLIPTIRVVRRVSLDEPLKDGAATTARTRQRYSGLVAAEVALALVLVMASGLLVKAVVHMEQVSDNFDARRLVTAFGRLGRNAVPTSGEMERIRHSVLARVRAIPGVVDAALEISMKPTGGAITSELTGATLARPTLGYPVVTPSFFRTMRLPMVEGRDFEDGDVAAGAAILNAAAAAYFYPHGSAVGRMIKLGGPASDAPWVRIVGVARTATMGRPGLRIHTPFGGSAVYVTRPFGAGPGFSMVVRLDREDAQVATAITTAIRGADPRMVGGGVLPYLHYQQQGIASLRFLSRVFVTIASFALVLAAIGLYGVLAYAVTQRTREFAIRVAIGAGRRDLLRVIAHDTAVMVLAGTAIGAFGALATTSMLAEFLADVHPSDVLTLITTEIVILGTAALAALGPARRAMRADPLEILRAT